MLNAATALRSSASEHTQLEKTLPTNSSSVDDVHAATLACPSKYGEHAKVAEQKPNVSTPRLFGARTKLRIDLEFRNPT